MCQLPRCQKQQNRAQIRGICLIDGYTLATENGHLSPPGVVAHCAPYLDKTFDMVSQHCLFLLLLFFKICLSMTDLEADVWERWYWSQVLDT